MIEFEFIKDAVNCVREWRKTTIEQMQNIDQFDLSFRSASNIPALGWILGHQAAVYDFSLNSIINGGPPKNPKLFGIFRPGTSGDWPNISLEEIDAYYDSGEQDFLKWIETIDEVEMNRVIQEDSVPAFFVGMTVRKVIATMFTHLNYHTGHLAAMRTEIRDRDSDKSETD